MGPGLQRVDRHPSRIYIWGSFSHFSKEAKVLEEGVPQIKASMGLGAVETDGSILVEETLSQDLQKQLRGPGPTELL